MPRLKSANFAVTELKNSINDSVTSLTVNDASLFPSEGPFMILVHDSTPGFAGVKELMEVGSINKNTNTLSDILRGRENTPPVAHSAGARVECVWTAGTHAELEDIGNKGKAGGYASLDTTGNIPAEQLGNVEGMEEHGNEWHNPAFATKAELDAHLADSASHSKTARFVVGTSTSGWTEKDCDYLCDGTDDQVEIIQALNDLPATGGEVVILDGTYNITASINIPKDNVSLRGNGNATILKRMYNSTNTDSGSTAKGLITLNGKSGCKIQGLQIDGNKATYTASYNSGIHLYSSSNNTVTSNTCNNNNNSGIYLFSSSSDNTVTGNTCNNNYYGISLYSSSNNTVTGNIYNNNNYGIYLSALSSDNTVTGNTCDNNNYGIHLYSSSNNTVTSNTYNNNNSYGIYLYSSSNNNTVTGNTCIRGTGTPEDYTTDQHTILLSGTDNDYNLISSNNCMGKAVVISGGTGNSAWGNKFDNTDDLL
jgi:parallel beta-helix repeat protein